ncbi:MAG: F0F1 ATP synthase subunit B [Kiloniellales bacterium]|nr:F0F1 ATP synthase subunit B [Kiloniellales bacterium]
MPDATTIAQEPIYADPTFWVALAFVVFMAFTLKPIVKAVTGGLDKRTDGIRKQLDEAEALRVEAQKLLADHKRKQRDAQKEAEDMLAHAKAAAERLRSQAEQELEQALRRREQLALDKIAQAEANALKEVRGQAVELAVAATAKLLGEKLDKATADNLVKSAIDDLDGKLH